MSRSTASHHPVPSITTSPCKDPTSYKLDTDLINALDPASAAAAANASATMLAVTAAADAKAASAVAQIAAALAAVTASAAAYASAGASHVANINYYTAAATSAGLDAAVVAAADVAIHAAAATSAANIAAAAAATLAASSTAAVANTEAAAAASFAGNSNNLPSISNTGHIRPCCWMAFVAWTSSWALVLGVWAAFKWRNIKFEDAHTKQQVTAAVIHTPNFQFPQLDNLLLASMTWSADIKGFSW